MEILSKNDLQKLHSLTLKMAETFVAFCEKNHLTCYLCGGGCIGTIRHKGWIPWDDDLDFFMPREDYEKAIRLWKRQMKDSRYKMEVSDENHIDGNLFLSYGTVKQPISNLIRQIWTLHRESCWMCFHWTDIRMDGSSESCNAFGR